MLALKMSPFKALCNDFWCPVVTTGSKTFTSHPLRSLYGAVSESKLAFRNIFSFLCRFLCGFSDPSSNTAAKFFNAKSSLEGAQQH